MAGGGDGGERLRWLNSYTDSEENSAINEFTGSLVFEARTFNS